MVGILVVVAKLGVASQALNVGAVDDDSRSSACVDVESEGQ